MDKCVGAWVPSDLGVHPGEGRKQDGDRKWGVARSLQKPQLVLRELGAGVTSEGSPAWGEGAGPPYPCSEIPRDGTQDKVLHTLEAIPKGAAGPGLPCSETLRLLLLADMLRQAGSSQGNLQHLPGLTDCAGARGRPWPEPQRAAAPHRRPERGCPEPRGAWGVRRGRGAGADSG